MIETKTTPGVPAPAGPIGPSTCGLKGGSKNGTSKKARIKGLTEPAEDSKNDRPEDKENEKNIHDLSAEIYSLQKKHMDLALKCGMLDAEMSALQERHNDLELKHETLAAELKALRIYFELTIQPGSICVKSAADDLETLGEAFTNHTHDGHGRPPVLPAAMFRKGSIRAGSGCGS